MASDSAMIPSTPLFSPAVVCVDLQDQKVGEYADTMPESILPYFVTAPSC